MPYLRALVSVPLLVVLAASCDRTSDVPRLHSEVLATTASYQAQLDELKRRDQQIAQRLNTLPAGAIRDVSGLRIYQQAKVALDRQRNALLQIPVELQANVKAGSAAALHKQLAALHERLDDGIRTINAQLDAVDSWIAIAGQRPSAPGPGAPAAPQPAGEAGSAAQIR